MSYRRILLGFVVALGLNIALGIFLYYFFNFSNEAIGFYILSVMAFISTLTVMGPIVPLVIISVLPLFLSGILLGVMTNAKYIEGGIVGFLFWGLTAILYFPFVGDHLVKEWQLYGIILKLVDVVVYSLLGYLGVIIGQSFKKRVVDETK